jgi:hypothetical protein
MIPRVVTAFIGASLITFWMFLGMSEVSKWFKERDPTQYFRVTQFIPQDTSRRPRRFLVPRAQPERVVITADETERALIPVEPRFSDDTTENVVPTEVVLDPLAD